MQARVLMGITVAVLGGCAKEDVPPPPGPARFAVRGGISTTGALPDDGGRFQIVGGGISTTVSLCNGSYCVTGGIRPWTDEEARSR